MAVVIAVLAGSESLVTPADGDGVGVVPAGRVGIPELVRTAATPVSVTQDLDRELIRVRQSAASGG